MPSLDNGDLGQPCAADGGAPSCASGEVCADPLHAGETRCFADCSATYLCNHGACFEVGDTTLPDVCIPMCQPSAPSCPTGWTCNLLSPDQDEEGYCAPGCTTDADCYPNWPYAHLHCQAGACRCTADDQCENDGSLRCDVASGDCYQPCPADGGCAYGCCATSGAATYCDQTGVPPATGARDAGKLLIGEDCSAWWNSGQTTPDPCDCNQCLNTVYGKICTKPCGDDPTCPTGWSCQQWYPSPDAMSCMPPAGFTPHAVGTTLDASCMAFACGP